MYELSIVILGYRAENYLEQFAETVMKEVNLALSISFEIILVANYDSDDDKTPKLARRLAEKYPNIKVLTLKKQGKMGWDMRKGLDEAKGEYICVIDGDGQMPASDIIPVYCLIKTGKFDLVKTYRSVRLDGILRRTLSMIYNLIFNTLFNPAIVIRDVNSKPKVLTREAYSKLNLKSNDWFTDAEIIIQAINHNFRIAEISTTFYKNERRKSFINLRTIFEFTYNLLYYRFIVNK